MTNRNRPSLIACAIGVLVLGAPTLALMVMSWPASLEVGKIVLTYVLGALFFAGLIYSRAFRVFVLGAFVTLFLFVGFTLNGVSGAALLALTVVAGVLAWRNMKPRRLDLLFSGCSSPIFLVFSGRRHSWKTERSGSYRSPLVWRSCLGSASCSSSL